MNKKFLISLAAAVVMTAAAMCPFGAAADELISTPIPSSGGGGGGSNSGRSVIDGGDDLAVVPSLTPAPGTSGGAVIISTPQPTPAPGEGGYLWVPDDPDGNLGEGDYVWVDNLSEYIEEGGQFVYFPVFNSDDHSYTLISVWINNFRKYIKDTIGEAEVTINSIVPLHNGLGNDRGRFTHTFGEAWININREVKNVTAMLAVYGEDGRLLSVTMTDNGDKRYFVGLKTDSSRDYGEPVSKIRAYLWDEDTKEPLTDPILLNSYTHLFTEDYDDTVSNADVMYARINGAEEATEFKLDQEKIKQGNEGGFYVNGRQIYSSSDDFYSQAVSYYILENPAGEIFLSDADSDGLYDYIYVTMHKDAVVDSVTINSETESTVYFNDMAAGIDSSWEIDTNDDYINYSISLNGKTIGVSELQEGDVLSIEYNWYDRFADSQTYRAFVSRDRVTGTVEDIIPSDRESDYQFILSDGAVYQIADSSLISARDLEKGYEYTLYLDAFGRIAKAEQSPLPAGILEDVYMSGSEYYAELITEKGEKLTARISDRDNYNEYLTYCYKSIGTDLSGNIITSGERKALTERVYNYMLNSSDEITINGYGSLTCRNSAAADVTYKKSTNKLDNYKINSEITAILDISDYEREDAAYRVNNEALSDGSEYTAYVFGKNASDGSCRLILIDDSETSVSAGEPFVIYSGFDAPDTSNGQGIIYAYDGKDTPSPFVLSGSVKYVSGYTGPYDSMTEEFEESDAPPYNEGDPLVLKKNLRGEVTKIIPLFNENGLLESGYNNLFDAATNDTEALTEIISPANGFSYKYYVDTGMQYRDSAYFMFGPIVDKSEEFITLGEYNYYSEYSYRNLITNIDYLDDLDFASDVTVYVYDYSKEKGSRISAGAKSDIVKTFVSVYNCADDYTSGIYRSDKALIDWQTFDTPTSAYGQVNYALVKMVGDDVTEVYVILPKASRR